MDKYNKTKRRNAILSNSLIIFLLILLALLLWHGRQLLPEQFSADSTIAAEDALRLKEQREQATRRETILERLPGIVCWGDDITEGIVADKISYASELAKLLKQNDYPTKTVFSIGISGEDSKAVMLRSGALKISIVNAFTIPESKSAVEMTLTTSNSDKMPLLFGDTKQIPNISIADIDGTLSLEQDFENPANNKYFFTRAIPGESVEVLSGTQIIDKSPKQHIDYIPCISIGQNGGWETPQELISQQQAIIDAHKLNADRALILGITTGSKEERKELEDAMEAHWGRKYINLRDYLSSKAINDAQLTPDADDLAKMSAGIIPNCLLSSDNDIKLTQEGYSLIAKIVYERLIELEYIEK